MQTLQWQREIMKAQYQLTYELNGTSYPRIPYSGSDPCRDCAVQSGMLHVPGCCLERCACCKEGQAISCGCREGDRSNAWTLLLPLLAFLWIAVTMLND